MFNDIETAFVRQRPFRAIAAGQGPAVPGVAQYWLATSDMRLAAASDGLSIRRHVLWHIPSRDVIVPETDLVRSQRNE